MSEIDLQDGDTEQIIPSDQANQAYIIEVRGNNVRIGHTERYARDGTTLEQGTNHRIDNLQGEQLFAHAHNGAATLRLSHAAANVDSQPTRDVTIVEGTVELSSAVGIENTNGTQIDPATDTTLTNTLSREIATWTAGTLPVEQQTPVGVEDSTGTQIDPAKNVNGSSATASAAGTGSSNAATINVPDGCRTVTVGYDTSGAATITVEVSPDGGTTWYPLTSYSPGSAATNADTIETGFDDVRAHINQNLNSLYIGAKGA